MTHLLVTNDFPPKVGGIQTYLGELWRRLPPESFAVLTTTYPGAAEWDRAQPFVVRRLNQRVLLPTPGMASQINQMASEISAGLVVLDPALPLGRIGEKLELPYAVVLHGAEVTVPGRVPGVRSLLARVLGGAVGIVAAGGYPAGEARHAARGARLPEIAEVPPGVDETRFRPIEERERGEVRRALGLPVSGPLVVSASRLVPRKGMDVLIEATTRLVAHRPDITVAIAGSGRDAGRLRTLAGRNDLGGRVRLLGRVSDADLPRLYGAADVFVMLCRNRWRGLEQEGFGIVFLEAAACGVPQVAGDSGGSAEAVVDKMTGLVVGDPTDPTEAAAAIGRLLDDHGLRLRMGQAARQRAGDFSWDRLALRLETALESWCR